jgi:hypothetical protein
MGVLKPYKDAAKGIAQNIWIRSLHGPQLVAAGKENWRESKVHPTDIPSQIPKGKHCQFFEHGASLYLEIDGAAIQRVRDNAANLVRELGDALQRFGTNHPVICAILAFWVNNDLQIAVGLLKKGRGLLLKEVYLLALSAYPGAVAVAWIIAIEAVILAVRASEIHLKDKNSVNGGVLIQLVFPNFQIQSVIFPRGGFKSGPFAR